MKNIHIYKTELPAFNEILETIHKHEGLHYTPCPNNSRYSFGFDPENPVTSMANGYRLNLISEEKVLPKQAVEREIEAVIKQEEDRLGKELELEESLAIREKVICYLVERALTQVKQFKAFYHIRSQLLIVDIAKESLGSATMRLICDAMGAVKSTTLHISGISNSLRTNILKCINENHTLAVAGFQYGDKLHLKSSDKESIKFDCDYTLDHIEELLSSKYEVEKVRLCKAGISFDLSSQFRITAIRHDLETKSEALSIESKPELIQHIEEALLELMAANCEELATYFEQEAA